MSKAERVFCLIAGSLGTALFGAVLFAPFSAIGSIELFRFMPILPLMLVLPCFALTIEALAFRKRVHLMWGVGGALVLVSAGVVLFWPGDRVDWRGKFSELRPQLEAEVSRLNKVDAAQAEVAEKPEWAAGAPAIHETAGKRWVFLPILIYGIDNGIGFGWNSDGLAPPADSYLKIVQFERLEDGWFIFWTT